MSNRGPRNRESGWTLRYPLLPPLLLLLLLLPCALGLYIESFSGAFGDHHRFDNEAEDVIDRIRGTTRTECQSQCDATANCRGVAWKTKSTTATHGVCRLLSALGSGKGKDHNKFLLSWTRADFDQRYQLVGGFDGLQSMRFGTAYDKTARLFKFDAQLPDCQFRCTEDPLCKGVFHVKQQVTNDWVCVGLSDLGDLTNSDTESYSYKKKGPEFSLPKNVLLLVADDLRPSLGFIDNEVITPNIDALSRRAMHFTRAYAQMAVCAPSRQSLLTGLRPDTMKIWQSRTSFREYDPNHVSLPQHFKNNGYLAFGTGKTFHNYEEVNYDIPLSWSEDLPYAPSVQEYSNMRQNLSLTLQQTVDGSQFYPQAGPNYEWDVSEYLDYKIASNAINAINYAFNNRRPFFVCAGFHFPHARHTVPGHIWDMYENRTISEPIVRHVPDGAPAIALDYSLSAMDYVFQGNLKRERTASPYESYSGDATTYLKRGYYGAITFMDSQVGRILDTLTNLGLDDSTIVVLTGDHGYKLGDNNMFKKRTNYEWDTRVPLLIRDPNYTPQALETDALFQLLDLYRTLSDLAGISAPHFKVEGRSLGDHIRQPTNMPPNPFAFSQFYRCPTNGVPVYLENECMDNIINGYMGYSVRSPDFRLTAWVPWDVSLNTGNWSNPDSIQLELYDHRKDLVAYGTKVGEESVNIAYHPDFQADVKMLFHVLQQEFAQVL
eukprot:m.214444 g.214444  ORF g.214444 m.214444 type:complete len:717 (-) comp22190_c1_seq12:120-2270(-)